MKITYLPNMITIARLLLTAPIFIYMMNEQYLSALYLFLLAAFTDGLDGFLARRFHCSSRFGAIADPAADKILVIFSMGALSALGAIPMWMFIVVLARDVCIVLVATFFGSMVGWDRLQPRYLSKVNTVLQLLLISMLLVKLSIYDINDTFLTGTMFLLLLTTIVSLFDYAWKWGQLCIMELKKNEQQNRAA